MNIISLGAGVQSSVMALMAARGEITPMPDAAIFADTQWEPLAVYEHLAWLESVLPFPVYRVTHGSLRAALVEKRTNEWRYMVPFFTPDGGMGKRQCTKHYKLSPIRRKVRELSGGSPVSQWIGITTDEAQRMKPSGVQYVTNTFPLIDLCMSRRDCEKWFERNYPGRPLTKSACTGCPFHSDAQWREIMRDPAMRADVIELDESIRNTPNGKQYMHRSCKPIGDVDFSTAEDRGQINLFNNECDGMCGV